MNAQPTSNLVLAPMSEPAPPAATHGWAANTELATRFLPRNEDQHDATKPLDPNIGIAVGVNTWEYFVSCAPSDALAQQFDVRTPVFMALHSLGEASSKRFLLEVAHHLKVPVQRLVIRRQGFGTELAVLYFADLATTQGQPLRVYSTDIKTDDATPPPAGQAAAGTRRDGGLGGRGNAAPGDGIKPEGPGPRHV